MNNYLFSSERLGFRAWTDDDLVPLAMLNADKKVMRYFPDIQTKQQTKDFIDRMSSQYRAYGFCYFAVERLEDGRFIGFIGLSKQTYAADFTPCIDIGWRLSRLHWGQGYATEGAKRCLEYAFEVLSLKEIYAVASLINIPSIRVMEKVGMSKVSVFVHPLIRENEKLRQCVLYRIQKA